MWGWKAVRRRVEHIQLGEATDALVDEGLDADERGHNYVRLKRPGKRSAPTGGSAPLDVKLLAKPADDGVEMHVAYDKFVAFDTGDLKREADKLQAVLVQVQGS